MGPYEPISLRSSSVTAGGSLRMKTERESGSMPGIAAGIALPPMPPPPIAPPPMTPPPIAPAPAIAPPAMPAMPLAAGLPPIPPPPPPPIICDAAAAPARWRPGLPPALRTCWSSACSICRLLVRAVTICGLLLQLGNHRAHSATGGCGASSATGSGGAGAASRWPGARLGKVTTSARRRRSMGPAGGAARLGCMDMIDPVTRRRRRACRGCLGGSVQVAQQLIECARRLRRAGASQSVRRSPVRPPRSPGNARRCRRRQGTPRSCAVPHQHTAGLLLVVLWGR